LNVPEGGRERKRKREGLSRRRGTHLIEIQTTKTGMRKKGGVRKAELEETEAGRSNDVLTKKESFARGKQDGR